MIRIGTRVPVTLPQRLFDHELIDLLHAAGKIWIQTHFNHPREITPDTARRCRNLVNAGMPVSNHAVLLKGVNDSVATMRQLMRGLLRIKVRPYYLFHCDPVTGAGHFRTSVWKGLEIIEGLRGHVSGLARADLRGRRPARGGQDSADAQLPGLGLRQRRRPAELRRAAVPLCPGRSPRQCRRAAMPTLGVSSLLSGTRDVLMPEGTPRMARRQEHGCRRSGRADAARRDSDERLSTPRPAESIRAPRLEAIAAGQMSG